MADLSNLRVAFVHYWLIAHRGGERVLEALGEIFPQADIFTLVYNPERTSPLIRRHRIQTSFIQKLPLGPSHHRAFLPLYPLALENFDLRGYDLVISSESGPAKGVITDPETCHICYCHTPMRYLWNQYHDYRASAGPLARAAMPFFAHSLRQWDLATASRVDYFVANSKNTARRIRKYYGREAEVIYPPVDIERFAPGGGEKIGAVAALSSAPEIVGEGARGGMDIGAVAALSPAPEIVGEGAGKDIGAEDSAATAPYYLVVSEMVPYKRIDLAVEAFSRLRRKLIVVGDGPELRRCRKLAGANVEFLGRVEDERLARLYAGCRAFIFPGEEDFGIAPVEAQASGRPVIAYEKGGALETVIGCDGGAVPGQSTGLFFGPQTVDALIAAIERFESVEKQFNSCFIRRNAEKFAAPIFRDRIKAFIASKLEEFRRR